MLTFGKNKKDDKFQGRCPRSAGKKRVRLCANPPWKLIMLVLDKVCNEGSNANGADGAVSSTESGDSRDTPNGGVLRALPLSPRQPFNQRRCLRRFPRQPFNTTTTLPRNTSSVATENPHAQASSKTGNLAADNPGLGGHGLPTASHSAVRNPGATVAAAKEPHT